MAELAKRLDVTHVVEGSVRKAADRVRISAQLTDAVQESQLWADRYDRDLDDIFAIQDEISKAIVAALRLKLLPKEKKAIETRGTSNSEAYDLYLLARQHWIMGSGNDRRAMEIVERVCRQAIALDENYAKAWGLMALAQMRLRITFDVLTDPKPAIDRALAIIAEAVAMHQPVIHIDATGKAPPELLWSGLHEAIPDRPSLDGVERAEAHRALRGLPDHVGPVGTTQLVTFVTALFPALAAALYGIRMQGDFAAAGERSSVIARQLEQLRTAIERDPLHYERLVERSRRLGEIMLAEVQQWRLHYETRPLSLPG